MDLRSHKGIVEISRKLLDEYLEKFDEVNPLFKDFVPAKIDYDYLTDTMKIYGYCKQFRPIFDGEVIPTYEAYVTTRSNMVHTTSAKFHEVKKFS